MTKEELSKLKNDMNILFENADKIDLEETPVVEPVVETPVVETPVVETPVVEPEKEDKSNLNGLKSLLTKETLVDGNYKVSLKLKDGEYNWETITNNEVEMSSQKEIDDKVIALEAQIKENLEKIDKQDKAILELSKPEKEVFRDAPDNEANDEQNFNRVKFLKDMLR